MLTDEKSFQDFVSSVISIDGPVTNDLTSALLNEPNNKFFKFHIPTAEEGEYKLIHLGLNRYPPLAMVKQKGRDFGVIIKLFNPRSKNDNYYFMCAGVGSHGTMAAAWYLATNWEEIYDDFGNEEFAILVETYLTAPTSATKILSMSEKTGIKTFNHFDCENWPNIS